MEKERLQDEIHALQRELDAKLNEVTSKKNEIAKLNEDIARGRRPLSSQIAELEWEITINDQELKHIQAAIDRFLELISQQQQTNTDESNHKAQLSHDFNDLEVSSPFFDHI